MAAAAGLEAGALTDANFRPAEPGDLGLRCARAAQGGQLTSIRARCKPGDFVRHRNHRVQSGEPLRGWDALEMPSWTIRRQ